MVAAKRENHEKEQRNRVFNEGGYFYITNVIAPLGNQSHVLGQGGLKASHLQASKMVRNVQ